ncbi:WD40 repeat-like protein [Exidia glandulosa HHB12029]|uniref:WD40 repeat-like protein n=1 Tax=Exidia glandulosa HHB12029 TaxID=1314781 RepID=A0A165DQP8_EXIGL|nr:WD40 repeat-like protein [Exidia glandulosa HHB12029]
MMLAAHYPRRAPLASDIHGALFLSAVSSVLFRASGELCIWNHETETASVTFHICRDDWVVAISPDGRFIASSGRNELLLASGESDCNTVSIWDTATGRRCLGPLPTPYIWSLAFSPDGSILASGGGDGHVLRWDTANGREVLPSITGPSQSINVVAFTPDGSRIVAGSEDGSICVWLVSTGELVVCLFDAHPEVFCLAFSPDNSQFASGGSDGSVNIWDATTYERDCTLPAPAATTRVTFSPDGLYIASYSDDDDVDKTILVWDLATRSTVGEPVSCHTVMDLAFEPGGGVLRAACADGTVRLVYFRLL